MEQGEVRFAFTTEKFYFAKDSSLTADVVKAYLGDKTISTFNALKTKHDPDGLFQSDLYHRCFGE